MEDINSLIARYLAGPAGLEEVISGVSDADADAVPIAGKWSIRQVVCHLSDSDIVYADRIRRILAEDNPTMADADPDRFVPALSCPVRNIREEVAVISHLRKATGRILTACHIEDFQRTGVHSKEGPMTLETIVERITGHIPHHLAFIRAKLDALAAN